MNTVGVKRAMVGGRRGRSSTCGRSHRNRVLGGVMAGAAIEVGVVGVATGLPMWGILLGVVGVAYLLIEWRWARRDDGGSKTIFR